MAVAARSAQQLTTESLDWKVEQPRRDVPGFNDVERASESPPRIALRKWRLNYCKLQRPRTIDASHRQPLVRASYQARFWQTGRRRTLETLKPLVAAHDTRWPRFQC
jgi:hypothetical protein